MRGAANNCVQATRDYASLFIVAQKRGGAHFLHLIVIAPHFNFAKWLATSASNIREPFPRRESRRPAGGTYQRGWATP